MTTPDTERLADDDRRPAADVILDAIALRNPNVPVTVDQIAALGEAGASIIAARERILATARKAAIRMTSPADHVLFKSPDGLVTAYLQDAGADRLRDVLGIEIFNVSTPQRVQGAEPHLFHYLITGSGRCRLTMQAVEAIEGGRSSTDDFAKGKTGLELELLIRKAARANLDGNITRELAGLKSIPVEELAEAWTGTNKRVDDCRRGRGFGTRDERLGARTEKAPDVDPPICPHCNATGVYRPAKGDRGAFYGCPNYGKHSDKKWLVDAAKWQQQQADDKAAAAEAKREPGQEG